MAITSVDPDQMSFVINHALEINAQPRISGPPQRLPGMTVGIIDMIEDAPHNGELHPDGDELLYVISGALEVTSDSTPDTLTLRAGDACIVSKGEWHKVHLLQPTRLLHITPGPNGNHRPLAGSPNSALGSRE